MRAMLSAAYAADADAICLIRFFFALRYYAIFCCLRPRHYAFITSALRHAMPVFMPFTLIDTGFFA